MMGNAPPPNGPMNGHSAAASLAFGALCFLWNKPRLAELNGKEAAAVRVRAEPQGGGPKQLWTQPRLIWTDRNPREAYPEAFAAAAAHTNDQAVPRTAGVKVGRPAIGDRAMTSAERKRRWKERNGAREAAPSGPNSAVHDASGGAGERSSIPLYLVCQPRWLLWRSKSEKHPKTGEIRATKLPISYRTGKVCDVTDQRSWADYEAVENALTHAPGAWDGVGFVLGTIEQLDELAMGLDLDSCLDKNEVLADWAAPFLQAMPSYAEISPSGSGIKIIARLNLADLPAARRLLSIPEGDKDQARTRTLGERSNGTHAPGAQLFLMSRFFCVTGLRWRGSPSEVVSLTLGQVTRLRELFGPKQQASSNGGHRDPASEDETEPGEAALRDKLAIAFLANPALRHRWEGGTEGLQDTSRSGRDMSMLAMLIAAGFAKGEVRAALCLFEHGKMADEDERYFSRMWQRSGAKAPPQPPPEWEDIPPPSGDRIGDEIEPGLKPTVLVVAGKRHIAADAGLAAIASAPFYVRDRALVRVCRTKGKAADGSMVMIPAIDPVSSGVLGRVPRAICLLAEG